MHYPLVNERVRMSDRADEFKVLSVDYAACVADIHLLADPKSIANDVPFRLLFAIAGFDPVRVMASSRERWSAGDQDLLHSSREHRHSCQEQIGRGRPVLPSIEATCSRTLETVRTSQQLIEASDRAIAWARTLYCDRTEDGGDGGAIE